NPIFGLSRCSTSGTYATQCGNFATITAGTEQSPAFCRAIDVNAELTDFLAQRVAIDPEQFRRLDLIAARSSKRRQDERIFHLRQNALIEAGGRQVAGEFCEIALQVMLDRLADGEIVRQARALFLLRRLAHA